MPILKKAISENFLICAFTSFNLVNLPSCMTSILIQNDAGVPVPKDSNQAVLKIYIE